MPKRNRKTHQQQKIKGIYSEIVSSLSVWGVKDENLTLLDEEEFYINIKMSLNKLQGLHDDFILNTLISVGLFMCLSALFCWSVMPDKTNTPVSSTQSPRLVSIALMLSIFALSYVVWRQNNTVKQGFVD